MDNIDFRRLLLSFDISLKIKINDINIIIISEKLGNFYYFKMFKDNKKSYFYGGNMINEFLNELNKNNIHYEEIYMLIEEYILINC